MPTAERDVVVLECDHVGTKLHTVATMVREGTAVAALRRKLAECDVVCANCHRLRTAARADWMRSRDTWREELEERGDAPARNALHLYDVLSERGCVDCGTHDLTVLEFDHVREKRGLVTRMARAGVSLATLVREIDACDVVCANCHRRRTVRRGGHYRARVQQQGLATHDRGRAPDVDGS